MNWLTDAIPPRIKKLLMRRDVPGDLWVKCQETGQMVFSRDLEENQFVDPNSGCHMRVPGPKRLEYIFDDGKYEVIPLPQVLIDPLKFKDEKRYIDRLRLEKTKTGLDDAILVGIGKLGGLQIVAAVQCFDFMGGSLGTAVGAGIISGIEVARKEKNPFVIFSASGGARMQEGVLSLMQLPRTIAAVQLLKEDGIPYIVVLTNPTAGGVTASYGMIGDINIAEPGAFIGFAGPRVIEKTGCEKLPYGFQRSEYLLERGMLDMVVHRKDLRTVLYKLCAMLMRLPDQSSDSSVLNEMEYQA